MKTFTFAITVQETKLVPIEADSFMQAYDVAVAYYPNHITIQAVPEVNV